MSTEISRPRRRRWIVAGIVMAGAVLAWLFLSEAPEVQLARSVKLGMTHAEVAAIVGSGEGMIDYGGPRRAWCAGRHTPAGFGFTRSWRS